ncbi:heme ABC exporter ATP-binding protein CcmA, partial [Fructobacillus ficulneus]
MIAKNSMPVLSVQNISKNYGDKEIVHDLSFDVHRGEILGLIGPNGAGKTTLLKMVAGFLTSDDGQILINGQDYSGNLGRLNKLVSPIFGGSTGFYLQATVTENLFFFANLFGLKGRTRKMKVNEALDLVDLQDHRDKKVSQLSMGMVQRLHLARGLLKDSPVLLLDEPTNGLDVELVRSLRTVIEAIAASGRAIVLTSHQLTEVSHLADRIVLIDHGHLVLTGDLEMVVEASGVTHIDRPATLEES